MEDPTAGASGVRSVGQLVLVWIEAMDCGAWSYDGDGDHWGLTTGPSYRLTWLHFTSPEIGHANSGQAVIPRNNIPLGDSPRPSRHPSVLDRTTNGAFPSSISCRQRRLNSRDLVPDPGTATRKFSSNLRRCPNSGVPPPPLGGESPGIKLFARHPSLTQRANRRRRGPPRPAGSRRARHGLDPPHAGASSVGRCRTPPAIPTVLPDDARAERRSPREPRGGTRPAGCPGRPFSAARETPRCSSVRSAGGAPPAEDGPSGPVSRRGVDRTPVIGEARRNRESLLVGAPGDYRSRSGTMSTSDATGRSRTATSFGARSRTSGKGFQDASMNQAG